MAVAAYASVLSLLRVIDNIQHPSRLRNFPDATQVDALREKLCFLQDFLELHSSTTNEGIECLVRKIPRVIYDAEIIINNYVVDRLDRGLENIENDVVCESFHDEIHRVIQQIESVKEALTTLKAVQYDQEKPRILDKFTSDKPMKNKMVGFDDQLNQVLEKLTCCNQKNLVIIPIVGMGGIGKTTLARNLFDHPYNLSHFSVRIWLTISQDYSVEKVLQGLLQDGVLDSRDLGHENEAELITKLHKKLFSQRYLIVLDDVWSPEAWDDLKRGFPNNGKGSRVMITTRLSDIACSLDSPNNNTYLMKFLGEDKSWDLFSEKLFEKGHRSLELEEIGRKISKRCKGLPLLLVLISGLLANSNMTVEYWQTVEENISSFGNSAYDEYCFRTLSLSYHHMPIHLKSCFLYMRQFEEDSDIKVSELIKRWVSQGFVKPVRRESLEGAARKYLEDLISRSMLLIRKRSKSGSIKICCMHDLLRDLSIKESNKERFLELPKTISLTGYKIKEKCVICGRPKMDMKTFHAEILGSESDRKILVCISCEGAVPEFTRSRFVVALKVESQNVPMLTAYRWITLYLYDNLPVFPTIRLFWNLEIFDVNYSKAVLPKELWEMPKLRHVKVPSFTLPYPVGATNDGIVLENLQTLTSVTQFSWTEEILRRIPNIRELGVSYYYVEADEEKDWSCFYLQNLARLQKLESLSIDSTDVLMDFNAIVFPCALKKLTLTNCRIAWGDLTIIGSLPNLEVLKLDYESVLGKEWNPIEGEFLRLKYLKLSRLNLSHWRVDGTHFPALETVVLGCLIYMNAIPREIGELHSLNSIYLTCCYRFVIESAKAIVEEQMSYGNERLTLHVINPEETYQIGGPNHA